MMGKQTTKSIQKMRSNESQPDRTTSTTITTATTRTPNRTPQGKALRQLAGQDKNRRFPISTPSTWSVTSSSSPVRKRIQQTFVPKLNLNTVTYVFVRVITCDIDCLADKRLEHLTV